METHKTSKNDFLASQNTSFVSPLHKEGIIFFNVVC